MNCQTDKGIQKIPSSSYEQLGTFPKSCGSGPNGPSCSYHMGYRTDFDIMMLKKWDLFYNNMDSKHPIQHIKWSTPLLEKGNSDPLRFATNISNRYAWYDQSKCKQYDGGEFYCENKYGPDWHWVENADGGNIACCEINWANAVLGRPDNSTAHGRSSQSRGSGY